MGLPSGGAGPPCRKPMPSTDDVAAAERVDCGWPCPTTRVARTAARAGPAAARRLALPKGARRASSSPGPGPARPGRPRRRPGCGRGRAWTRVRAAAATNAARKRRSGVADGHAGGGGVAAEASRCAAQAASARCRSKPPVVRTEPAPDPVA